MHEPAALMLYSRFRNMSVKAPEQVAIGIYTKHQASNDQTTKAVLPSKMAQGTRRKDAEACLDL